MSSFATWPLDINRVFVSCKDHRPAPATTASAVRANTVIDPAAPNFHRLQPATARVFCHLCRSAGADGEFCQIDDAHWPLRTVGALQSALSLAAGGVPIKCFHDASHRTGVVVLRCEGKIDAETRCKNLSFDSCAPLLQCVATPEGFECPVIFAETDYPAVMRFDPCGHVASVEAIALRMASWNSDGMGRSSVIRAGPDSHVVPHCPVDGCIGSVLHDVHHYSILPDVDYERIKLFGCNDHEEHDPDNQQRRPQRVPDDNDEAPASPDAVIMRRVQQALDTVLSRCPTCGVAGQKNEACTHVRCQNLQCANHAAQYCFFCDRPFSEIGSTRLHKADWASRRDRCVWFLHWHPDIHVQGADGNQDTQRFFVLKALRLLSAIRDDVGADSFNRSLDGTTLLTDLFQISDNNQTQLVPATSITLQQVAEYNASFGNRPYRMP